jgi:hypothetical protein
MATIDLCFNTICSQRKERLNFTTPPVRFELTSPYLRYPQYKQNDFDMRRKAEILKYSGPQSTIKLNKLTKAERFSQVVRGYSPVQKSIRNNNNNNNNNNNQNNFCDSSMNRVLTTSSDVPGPRPIYI